ncbi:hypothetical protein CerSpe_244830 [Prunus speciosa]
MAKFQSSSFNPPTKPGSQNCREYINRYREDNDKMLRRDYFMPRSVYPFTCVKTFPNPNNERKNMFSKYQEAYCKDVEQCFGILQARFGIIRGAIRMWKRVTLQTIMIVCIILHNMIVDDEHAEDEEDLDVEEVDTMNPRIVKIYERLDDEELEPVGETDKILVALWIVMHKLGLIMFMIISKSMCTKGTNICCLSNYKIK